ncbi:MAG: FKBP-type peptidyl-prolyl cis-trans isomerase [Muribaculaceae bacterium]|nr:FKBP-type peptidyl-prolyl cis-trans isomerase [Muribaculaceae bacterium]
MKKIILGALGLALLAGMSSCGKCGSDKSCTTNDSLSTTYGEYVGTMVLADFSNMNSEQTDKQQFLKGMQLVMGADDSQSTRMGMQVALQLSNELNQLKEQGIDVDATTVYNSFKKAFLADSVDFMQIQEISNKFRGLYDEAREQAQAKKDAERAQAPDAVQNETIGKQYIADQMAANPAVKVTENGLGYLIEVPGVDPKPEATSTVEVNYTGRLINGTVFDTTDGRGPATFPLTGVVPGFREGIMLLGKGGKATLYIPGNLAYGVNGQPAAGIGPNELLIFDVELLEIK